MRRFVKRGWCPVTYCFLAWLLMTPAALGQVDAVSIAAHGATTVATVPGTGWELTVINPPTYKVQARASFDGGPFSPWLDSLYANKFGFSAATTLRVLGPEPGSPYGLGGMTH